MSCSEHEMRKVLDEIRGRARRIETRLTGYMEQQGYDTQARKPVWRGKDILSVPSMACSLHDIVDALPGRKVPAGGFDIYHKDVFVMSVADDPEIDT